MERIYQPYICKDLENKMVFLGGPRQVGKTTLCNMIANTVYRGISQYLNWDADEDRKIILNKAWPKQDHLIVLDELHKYSRWKQWIKGVYDTKEKNQQYLITGSARLDVYRKGVDSLFGRYHYWRLHPLSLDEYPKDMNVFEAYDRLLNLGGFPEPFLMNNEREARRWRRERFNRIVREDIRDLTMIKDTKLLQLFIEALKDRTGQLVVLSNIAEDLQIAPATAKSWLKLIEDMYLVFAVYPLTKNIPRAIQKPPKVYFFDNGDPLNNHGARLENLVAATLLKRLHFLEDFYGHRCKLHYIRDRSQREVDFVTTIDQKIYEIIEVKSNDHKISSALKYYTEKLKPKKSVQLVEGLKRSYEKDGILVTTPVEYFSQTSLADPIE